MKAHEITFSEALAISGLTEAGVDSMLKRGVLHRVEKGNLYIQRASFVDCLAKDREAAVAVNAGLAFRSVFWDDLEQDLEDPVFVEAYVKAVDELVSPSKSS